MKTTLSMKPVYEANEQMKGTKDYMKYHMEMSSFINGKWVFIGWYVPSQYQQATIKKVKNNSYLIIEHANGEKDRYVINKHVAIILGIEI